MDHGYTAVTVLSKANELLEDTLVGLCYRVKKV